RVPDTDEGDNRVGREQTVDAGVKGVVPACSEVVAPERKHGEPDEDVGSGYEEQAGNRSITHLGRTPEGALVPGDGLHDRGAYACQVDGQRNQVEAVDTEDVGSLVATLLQVARHRHEIRQRNEPEKRSHQLVIEGISEKDDQAEGAPADGGHVVEAEEHLA